MFVLIVEDDSSFATLSQCLLESAGIESRVVPTITEALKVVGANPPDAILLDLALPDSPPDHTIETIPKLSAVAPVIVITACVEPDVVSRVYSAGADTFVSKFRSGGPYFLSGIIGRAAQRRGLRCSIQKALAEPILDEDSSGGCGRSDCPLGRPA